jgi:hypothetical protein
MLSTPTTPDAELSSSPEVAPEHVAGENYIDPDERAGLPGTDLNRYSKAAATKVVHAHKRGFLSHFVGRHRPDAGADGRGRDPEKRRARRRQQHRRSSSAPESIPEHDLERDAQVDAAAPRRRLGGMGMLSALLTLYEHPDAGRSTPSLAGSREASQPPSPAPASRRTSTVVDSLSATVRGALRGGDRPAPARNGAGVFGALVASTGNIAGAAAPVPSSLAPNVKRPGYHLSRYSIDARDPVKQRTLQHCASADTDDDSPGLSRSQSHPVLTGGGALAIDTDVSPAPHGPRSDSPATTATTDTALHAGHGSSSVASELDLPLPRVVIKESQSLPPTPGGGRRTPFTGILKDLPKPRPFGGWSAMPSPSASIAESESYFFQKEVGKSKEDRERRERKRKRKKAEIFVSGGSSLPHWSGLWNQC